MRAYPEAYVSGARERLGLALHYAVNACGIEGPWFCHLLAHSEAGRQFERGNPCYVAGMSGIELARAVLHGAYGGPDGTVAGNEDLPDLAPGYFSDGYSAEYWVGWALGYYQWWSARPLRRILEETPYGELRSMYPSYHEMDVMRFVEALEARRGTVGGETRLKRMREARGMAQVELAQAADVNVRSIQMYEQRVNDIDKAQARTLARLATVLGCSIEDLLEDPTA